MKSLIFLQVLKIAELSELWYIDSGSSKYITRNKREFYEYREI